MSCLCRPGPVAGGGSKLGELIGKLHEYMAAATEDKTEATLPGHWNGEYSVEEKLVITVTTETEPTVISHLQEPRQKNTWSSRLAPR